MMSVKQLDARVIEKVWGRRDLPAAFGDASQLDEPVGEIWFEDAQTRELLVKRIFTSQKLSIQVHPTDEQARSTGHACGKDEAWYVLSAEQDAVIGAGFDFALSLDELRAAALDGSIEDLMTWHPVKPGDFFYVPAGTVHAIGAGLSVLEIQQNVDLTYRLFDYGRPRALQIEEGLSVARPFPFAHSAMATVEASREILVEGPKFVIERLRGPAEREFRANPDKPVWFMPISHGCEIGGAAIPAGTVWLAEMVAQVTLSPDGCLLVAYSGSFAG